MLDPAAAPNPVFGLQADALGLADGTAVAAWADISGQGHGFAQSTSAARPVYHSNLIGGHGAVEFDGVDDCLASAAPLTLTSHTVILALAGANGQMLIEQSANANSNDGMYLEGNNNDTFRVKRGSSAIARDFNFTDRTGAQTPFTATEQWFVLAWSNTGDDSSQRLSINGQALLTQTQSPWGTVGTSATTDTIYLGCRGNSSLYFVGRMEEVWVYSPALDGETTRQVVRWILNRLGL